MGTESYKVKLEGAGLTLEREVEKSIGEQIAVLIIAGIPAAKATAGNVDVGRTGFTAGTGAGARVPTPTGGAAGSSLSVREFLNAHEPKRTPDKIAAIGVYIKDQEKKDVFSKAEIEKAFEDAGEPIPKNMPRDMKWAVKAGWIAPKSGAKGKFYVTHTGREAVTKHFPKEVLRKTRSDGGGRKKKRVAAAT